MKNLRLLSDFYSATIKAVSYALVGNREPIYRNYWDRKV